MKKVVLKNETLKKLNLDDLEKQLEETIKNMSEEFTQKEDEAEDDDYLSNAYTKEISFIEMAIINSYLYNCYNKSSSEIKVNAYGQVDSLGKISYGSAFDAASNFWFQIKLVDDNNDYFAQTKMYQDSSGELIIMLNISAKKGIKISDYLDFIKKIMDLSFNNSEYKGKCIKVKLSDGRFRGIEIIDTEAASNELILKAVQKQFIEHFIKRVGRGGNARYLLNGEPGTGKTETIREIVRRLIPNVTFIIPDFSDASDLTSILEACEIFENGVIIMDDIDLYLGSRENGSYTRLLGQFLSFFDGVKKRKISLLASTNDKGLVDKAAERPGRFNFTIDYSFLDDDQIKQVCDIHLPEKWRVKEVFDALTGNIGGKKVNITGAFIANLADNIREMSEDDEEWTLENTVSLIRESYKGFYSSQVEKEKKALGFGNVK
jgi:hypothetical protein